MKILFVGHYAGHTGAPIVLLRLLKWLKDNTEINYELILRRGGALLPEYQKLTRVICVDELYKKSRANIFDRFFKFEISAGNRFANIYKKGDYDLIFSNTITNGDLINELSYLDCPVVCRVAELDYWINRAGPHNLAHIKRHVRRYIAVSEAVRKNLSDNHGIDQNIIEVVPGFISKQEGAPIVFKCKRLRKELGIPENGIIVGASGTECWRKGKDVFLQLAIRTVRKYPEIPFYFVWVGGNLDDEQAYQFRHDIVHAGIQGRAFFLPQVDDPLGYFNDFDLFAMVSREDPYPIVNLEVASLGKPIVCFANSGGSAEFVGVDAGFVVPYLDIEAMSEKLSLLALNAELKQELGIKAYEKVMEKHNVTRGSQDILNVIMRSMAYCRFGQREASEV